MKPNRPAAAIAAKSHTSARTIAFQIVRDLPDFSTAYPPLPSALHDGDDPERAGGKAAAEEGVEGIAT
jgi:hypothetical protein